MTQTPTLSPEELKLVAEALAMLPAGPWSVASSNSFRRINGPDGKDGGVLQAYAQRGDGHPDLSMSEQALWALCRVVNAAPFLLVALEEAEGRLELASEIAASRVHAETFEAMKERAEKAEQQVKELAATAMGNGVEIGRLLVVNAKLGSALAKLTDACHAADACEELPEDIDGSMLDEAEAAIALIEKFAPVRSLSPSVREG